MKAMPNPNEDTLSPALQRQIKKLHKRMDAEEAAGGVIPRTPIVNRVTGRETQFGPRRAYDGPYVLELLTALGCTNEQVASTRYVLGLLDEHHLEIGKYLLTLLRIFHDQETIDEGSARARDKYRRDHIHIVE